MEMTLDIIDPSIDINWDEDFIWVQMTSLLKVIEKEHGHIKLRQHNGDTLTLSSKAADEFYYPILNGSVLKPRYAPIKAHCLGAATTVRIQDADPKMCVAGSAICLSPDGAYSIINKQEFLRDYQAVGYPEDKEYPNTPFPSRDHTAK